jgi:hypothetical protein
MNRVVPPPLLRRHTAGDQPARRWRPEVLELAEVDRPTAGADDAPERVHGPSVNAADF